MRDWANGSYNICLECAWAHAGKPTESRAIGMWLGECDICGATAGLSNAWHDWGLSDEAVETIMREDWDH